MRKTSTIATVIKPVFWIGCLALLPACVGQEAAHALEVRQTGAWSGNLGGIAGLVVSGDFAYAAARGLEVMDLSDPANPVRLSNFLTNAFAYHVAVSGNSACVIEDGSSLRVYDITNPTNPVPRGATPVSGVGTISSVALAEGYAYVAGSGLRVVDVSDPENPEQVGGTDTAGHAHDIAVSDHYAFVAASSSLQIFDVITPGNPVLVGGTNFAMFPRSIVVSGSHAYLAGNGPGRGLQIIDISIPTNPAIVGRLEIDESIQGLAVSGNYAYLTGSSGLTGYVHRLRVIDISNPTNPFSVGTYEGRVYDFDAVAVSSGYAYVLGGARGMDVINVTNPANPFRVARLHGSGGAESLAVSGQHAYVASGFAGLDIVDVSDVANPQRVGNFQRNDVDSYALDVGVSGDHAYVLDQYAGLQTLNMSDPTNPVPVGNCPIPANRFPDRLVVEGNAAYATYGDGYQAGLLIFGLSNPTNPVILKDYPFSVGDALEMYPRGLAVSSNRVYATYNGTLWNPEFGLEPYGRVEAINVANPASPTLATGWHIYGEITEVAASGGRAYFGYYYPASQIGGIGLIPGMSAVYHRAASYPAPVAMFGQYLYVLGTHMASFGIFDVSNPTNLVLAAEMPYGYNDMATSARHVFLADGSLRILELRPRLFADSLGAQLQLKWAAGASDYLPEHTLSLSPPEWQAMEGTPQIQNGFKHLNVPATNPAAFFRLRQP